MTNAEDGMTNDQIPMTNAGDRMTNDQIPMTNECPSTNVQYTSPDTPGGAGAVIGH